MFHSRIVRRSFVLGAAVAALGTGPRLARAQTRLEKSRLLLAVGVKSAFQNLPLTIADRLGYFSAEGLDVEILDLVNGQRAQQAVMEGAADVACGVFEGLLDGPARNHHLRSFVLLSRAPQIAFGVSSRNLPGFKRVAELRGRKIAVGAPGSSAHLVAALVLARQGLTLKDVQLSEVAGAGAAMQAVRAGQVDVLVHTEPVISMLEQKGDIRVIADTRSLKGSQELFGGNMPAACLFASAQAVQNQANTLQALTNAVVRALKWLQTAGPSDLIKVVPEPYLLGDRGMYLAAFGKLRESISLDGLMPEDGPKTAMRALERVASARLPEKMDLEQTYTNEFARKSKEKFRA
ncbi:MAG: ABC transporter substrate-binding protein [Burkholderiaceae bacterium]